MWSLYMPMHVGSNIAQKCENFTKSEIYSNIAQNQFHISPIWPLKVIQLKNHEVNWKTIYMYMTSYVFQVSFDHDMHHSKDTAH